MTFQLNFNEYKVKCKHIDRKAFFAKYNVETKDVFGLYNEWAEQKYKLSLGAPILINVEGILLTLDDLVMLSHNNAKVQAYVRELKYEKCNKDSSLKKEPIIFKWRNR